MRIVVTAQQFDELMRGSDLAWEGIDVFNESAWLETVRRVLGPDVPLGTHEIVVDWEKR